MNADFRDILSALNDSETEFLLVGAHALAVYGRVRATGDLDLWIRPSMANAARLRRALQQFGAPITGLSDEDLATPGLVFQFGLPPRRIDLLTAIDGVSFDEAWPERQTVQIAGLTVPVISRRHLLRNKQATGRPQNLADASWLDAHPGS